MGSWLIRLLAEAWVVWVAGLLGAAGLAWLKHTWPAIADKALYGLLGFVLVVTVILAVRFERFLSKQAVIVTVDSVEDHVRRWSDNFGFAVQRVTEKEAIEKAVFALRVLINDRPALVYRPKDRPAYLNVQAGVVPSPEHLAALDKLSAAQREVLTEEIRLALGTAGLDFIIEKDLKPITVVVRLPVTGLTEHAFMSALDRALLGQVVARDAMVLGLRRIARQ